MAEILLPPTDVDSMKTPPVFDTDEKKKRNRDVLSPNSIDLRFLGPSQKKLFYQARNTTIGAIFCVDVHEQHQIFYLAIYAFIIETKATSESGVINLVLQHSRLRRNLI